MTRKTNCRNTTLQSITKRPVVVKLSSDSKFGHLQYGLEDLQYRLSYGAALAFALLHDGCCLFA